ncbi:alpha/beta hydrolase family protein [Streptomyces sp. NPDC048638]|uniref:alpha/beta hydrolase family protein n=1 Tax=Streptomyces sp. NPDC048638 TaxID=3365580 RepID=UPI003710301C
MIRKTAGHGDVGRRAVIASATALGAGLALAGCGGAAGRPAKGAPMTGDPARAASGPAEGRGAAGAALRLPAPTGPHRIGATTLYLVDRSRRDPWERIAVREVMVTVFYPARRVGGHPVAPQMTRGAAEAFAAVDARVHHLPAKGVDWAATRTHAHADAPALPGRRPVLLYGPGGGDPRTLGTGLAEELASHGRVVVTVDHPGDAGEVDFPVARAGRERVRCTVFRADPRADPRQFATMIDTRVADLRFVLDQLAALAAGRNPDAAGRPLPAGLGRALDLRRVGCYGHSAGGTAAAEAMYEDRRIGATVNLEGYLDHPPKRPGEAGELYPVARHGVDRPLLLVGSERFATRRERDRSWAAALAHPHRRVERREIARAAHFVFTDHAAMAPQLQAAGLMTARDRNALVGPVAPATSVPLVRRAVHSFFARHLPAR